MAKSIKVKVAPPTGDPVNKIGDTVIPPARGKTEQQFDIRDRLAELIGKGNILSADDKAAIYGNLSSTLGQEKAQKIMTHAYLFNQRPDVLKLPLEDKIRAFYTIGSNDKDVNDVITSSRALGSGAIPGFRQSASAVNQQLNGQIPVTASGGANPELQKKIMVKIIR